jgi:hypothetical protein
VREPAYGKETSVFVLQKKMKREKRRRGEKKWWRLEFYNYDALLLATTKIKSITPYASIISLLELFYIGVEAAGKLDTDIPLSIVGRYTDDVLANRFIF